MKETWENVPLDAEVVALHILVAGWLEQLPRHSAIIENKMYYFICSGQCLLRYNELYNCTVL